MTKQVFQLKDAVPTSKPDVPATREHPMFAPGHAPVQQPQGAPPETGTAQRTAPPGCEEAQGPRTGQTRAEAKSQAKELYRRGSRRPVSRVRHRHLGAAALRVRHAAGPSKWIWAAGEVKHRYRVSGDHQGFEIHVKWDPATPNDKQVGRTIELWRDGNGREMVPLQLCDPDTEHLTGTEYTGEVHNAWPLAQPQKRNRKAPAAQGVIDLFDA